MSAKSKKVKLTKEQRKLLVGVGAVSSTVKYTVHVEGLDESLHPYFILNKTTCEQRAQQAEIAKKYRAGEATEDELYEIVRLVCVDWGNLFDFSTDEFLNFMKDEEGEHLSREGYLALPRPVRAEIFSFINNIDTGMSKEDVQKIYAMATEKALSEGE